MTEYFFFLLYFFMIFRKDFPRTSVQLFWNENFFFSIDFFFSEWNVNIEVESRWVGQMDVRISKADIQWETVSHALFPTKWTEPVTVCRLAACCYCYWDCTFLPWSTDIPRILEIFLTLKTQRHRVKSNKTLTGLVTQFKPVVLGCCRLQNLLLKEGMGLNRGWGRC